MPRPPQGWLRPFEDPIPLPRGRALVTLTNAAGYIQKLPGAEQRRAEWQTAVEILIATAEARDFVMHARIGVLKAINRDRRAPEPGPRRKKPKAFRIIPVKNA